MSKRRLSKQQTTRVHQRRKADDQSDPLSGEDHLGPEQPGLVISHFRNQADVETEADGKLIRCHMRANLGNIVAGDRVLWREGMEKGVISAVFPRQSELLRPDSYGKLKLVAANVDRALITIAPEPEAHGNLIDRYLVIAEYLGIEAVLLVNKADLLSPDHEILKLLDKYQSLGYKTFQISAKNDASLNTLREYLSQGTSIFVGQSGVGKSSIIQTLLPDESIKIGELSEQVKKGKHTTTHARLYHFPFGGHCIDSPGIREFGLWHLSVQDVALGFREFREHVGACRFRDCSHQHEPGCALLQAISDGLVQQSRFHSYLQIVNSLDDVNMQGTREQ